ncbi:MAG: hypothetical protein VCA37_18275 [Roseibacillus sp.]
MFHMLYTLRDYLSYLPDLNLIVSAHPKGDTLFIHDLIGPEIPTFAVLQPYLQMPAIEHCEFGFVPDRLAVNAGTKADDNGDGTHVDGHFPLTGTAFRFPSTAHA